MPFTHLLTRPQHRKEANQMFKRIVLVAGTRTRRKWQKTLRGSYRGVTGHPSFEAFLKKELRA
jgi:hypothetical protein